MSLGACATSTRWQLWHRPKVKACPATVVGRRQALASSRVRWLSFGQSFGKSFGSTESRICILVGMAFTTFEQLSPYQKQILKLDSKPIFPSLAESTVLFTLIPLYKGMN